MNRLLSSRQIIQAVLCFLLFAVPIFLYANGGAGKYIDQVDLPTDELPALIAKIIRAGLTLVGTVALAFFIYGGFIYITSGGDEKQVEQGKKIMVYAIIGILAIGLSYAVVSFVIGAFDGGGAGGFG